MTITIKSNILFKFQFIDFKKHEIYKGLVFEINKCL